MEYQNSGPSGTLTYSEIIFVCFVFEQSKNVQIQLALTKPACFPVGPVGLY